MNFIKFFLRLFGSKTMQRLRLFGLNVHRVHDVDIQLEKLKKASDPSSRLRLIEKLFIKFPNHPKIQIELIKCKHKLVDNDQFDQMNQYPKMLDNWLVENGLEEINIEFVWSGIVTGSFGNHYALEGLLRANKYGLRSRKKLYLLLPERAQLRNPALFSYFEPFLNVIRDSEVIQAMKSLESILTLPLGFGLPMDEKCPFLDIAANMSEIERKKLGQDRALFQLSKEHFYMGKQVLKKLGLPENAWYVTLHVREPGYRGETVKNTTEDWRNANPLDYIDACNVVTKAGGWVFRMGDPSMTDLPHLHQVIDYANRDDIRSDWMDVFLGATSRFLIGTASGFLDVPGYFGVPKIFTNSTQSVGYFALTENDLYLPRLLRHKNSGRYLSFEEYMSPPISMLAKPEHFLKEGLEWIENTPEELKNATIEMLKKTNENEPLFHDEELQKQFKKVAEKCGIKHGGHYVKAFAPISSNFLEKYVDLLETKY